jgi:hypothetical protein
MVFHPEGTCLYSCGKGFINVFGWEPVQLHETVNLPDASLPYDIAVAHDQLVSFVNHCFQRCEIQH